MQGEGPALGCNQVSAWELEEAIEALEDVQRNGGKYAGGGVDSVYRYASAIGLYSGSIPDFDPDGDENDSDDDDDGSDGEEIPIEST